MKILDSFLKKALILLVAIASTILGSKVFAQKANHSAFFTKHYTKTSDLANDIEQGKKYLVHNVAELQFINLQLDNWNTQLAVNRVLNNEGNIFQLKEKFTSVTEAKTYFIDILRNHCVDNQLTWNNGDYLLARVNKSNGVVTDDWLRANNPNEVVAELVPNSFDEVSSSDGDYATIPGFSLYCGNRMAPKKTIEPKAEPAPRIVYKEREKDVLVRNPNNSEWGDPPKTKTTTTSTTSSGGNVTYNTYNTSTTNVENPAPIIVKNNQNGQMLLMAGMMVVGQVMGTMLNIWSMKQQYKMMPQQAINYSPVYYLPQSIPVNNPGLTPIQGFATGNDWAANPIQGNTGGNTWANPIQGGTNYTPTANVYDPIQGNTQFTVTNNLVYDPIQGWVLH